MYRICCSVGMNVVVYVCLWLHLCVSDSLYGYDCGCDLTSEKYNYADDDGDVGGFTVFALVSMCEVTVKLLVYMHT